MSFPDIKKVFVVKLTQKRPPAAPWSGRCPSTYGNIRLRSSYAPLTPHPDLPANSTLHSRRLKELILVNWGRGLLLGKIFLAK